MDATNVARVAHYIRDKTRPPAERQQQQQRGDVDGGDGEDEYGASGGGELGRNVAAAAGDTSTSHFQSIVISLKVGMRCAVIGLHDEAVCCACLPACVVRCVARQ